MAVLRCFKPRSTSSFLMQWRPKAKLWRVNSLLSSANKLFLRSSLSNSTEISAEHLSTLVLFPRIL